MSKNKIIFFIIAAVLIIATIFLFLTLASSGSKKTQTSAWKELKIWVYDDAASDYTSIIDSFKENYPQYKSKSITVESFWDELTYEKSLTNALFSWNGPDIFMLGNESFSPLENNTIIISPSNLSPNDFRLNFKPFFSDNLIVSDPENPTVEYVKWVPIWYESLWVIYNIKYFRPSNLSTWENVLWSLEKVLKKPWNVVPIALWNGVGVSRVAEVIASLFSLEWVHDIKQANGAVVKQVLSFYKAFWDEKGTNTYDEKYSSSTDRVDIDAFTSGNVAAVLWFPRDIKNIESVGYQKSLLYASHFPGYADGNEKQTIFFRYLWLNSDSENIALAEDFLAFVASEAGQEKIITSMPYYLPASASVESKVLEQKIYPNYNIVYKNFIDTEADILSFDMWDKQFFTSEVKKIADMERGYETAFEKMRSYIVCSSQKIKTLLNISSSCK